MKLLRKRVLVPAALFLSAALLAFILVLRGSWASPEKEVPGPGRPVTQIWLQPDGRKVVLGGLVVERPLDRVWSVVSGYADFPKVFPTIVKAESNVEPDGRHRLRADVEASWLGVWPVDILIRHDEKGDVRAASWDQPTGDILRNRGSWVLTKLDEGRTRVEYLLDVEIRRTPDWFVRAILRGRQKGILRALDQGARR